MPNPIAIVEKYNKSIAGLEDAAIARLEKSLNASYKIIEQKIRAKYQSWQEQKLLTLVETQRLQEIKELIQLINPDNAAFYEQEFQQLISGALGQSGNLAEELVKAIAPARSQSFAPQSQQSAIIKTFGTTNFEAAAAAARDAINRLKNHSAEFAERASSIIQQSLIQGWGASRAAVELRKELGILKSKAETIARTETIAALDTANRDRYRAAGIEAVQVIAIGDLRTCPFCLWRNGKVFKITESQLPLHPRCRCYSVPWVSSWDTDPEFVQEYANRAIAQAEVEPDSGAAPFERLNNKPAPVPVWIP